jgi:elongation factor Ts
MDSCMFGYIASYVHNEGRIGVLVEFACKDSFTTKTSEFRTLARDIAIHIAASKPVSLAPSDLDAQLWDAEVSNMRPALEKLEVSERQRRLIAAREQYERHFCLMKQPFVKDDSLTIEELITRANTEFRESIRIVRFVRYQVQEG